MRERYRGPLWVQRPWLNWLLFHQLDFLESASKSNLTPLQQTDMKKSELLETMIGHGWSAIKMGGGPLFKYPLEDRFLISLPRVADTGEKFIFYSQSGVGFEQFSHVIASIAGTSFSLTAVEDFPLRLARFETVDKTWDNLIGDATESLIAFAQRVELTTVLQNHAEIEKASWPTFNLHLASLAMLGESDRLKGYREKILSEETVGLHPLMTLAAVDKTLEYMSGGNP